MKRVLLVPLVVLFLPAVLLGRFAPAPLPANKDKGRLVVMKTSMGTIKIELFADKAPITVKNFLAYVDAKHYDGILFHRVIRDFMIQGGGFKKGLMSAASLAQVKEQERPTKAPIVNEARKNGLSNLRGTIATARTSEPNSATAQFFINVIDNPNLDPGPLSEGYCVFGRVVEGMDVVDKIRAVATKQLLLGFADVPIEPVVIESARRARN
jgi:cyclophilin family peptidyl-prolyl cis-trans isomerase